MVSLLVNEVEVILFMDYFFFNLKINLIYEVFSYNVYVYVVIVLNYNNLFFNFF